MRFAKEKSIFRLNSAIGVWFRVLSRNYQYRVVRPCSIFSLGMLKRALKQFLDQNSF